MSDMIPFSAVPRRVLGRTGLEVSALGFGTAPLGDLFAQLDDGTAIAAVERAFELGINLLDTSPLYGHGLSEHRCGTALRRVPRQDIVVCTKVGRWMDPFHGRATVPALSVGSRTAQWSTILMTAPCVRWNSRCCGWVPTGSTCC